MNQKGVVERDFTKKEAFYVFQSYWTEKPMVHIYGHSWPVRWGELNEEKMLKVYSNCDKAELFLNGKSVGVKTRSSQDFPASGLRWNLKFLPGRNTVRVLATKGKLLVEDEISFDYETRKWTEPALLKIEKISEENGVAVLEVKLFDKNGVQCLDAANVLRFSLAGDGKLIDNRGTSTGSRVLQMYNGRAVIKVLTKEGSTTVAASTPGLKTVSLNL